MASVKGKGGAAVGVRGGDDQDTGPTWRKVNRIHQNIKNKIRIF